MESRKRPMTEAEIARAKKIAEDWDKPLSLPRPVPKAAPKKKGKRLNNGS